MELTLESARPGPQVRRTCWLASAAAAVCLLKAPLHALFARTLSAIETENQRPGTPGWYRIKSAEHGEIQAYGVEDSIMEGESPAANSGDQQ